MRRLLSKVAKIKEVQENSDSVESFDAGRLDFDQGITPHADGAGGRGVEKPRKGVTQKHV